MPLDFNLLDQGPRINTPFENLSQILQVRQQQESAKAQAEQRRAMAAQTNEQTQLLQQKQADTASVDAAFGSGGTPEEMLARVPGHLRATMQKQFQEAAEWNQKVKDAKTAAEKAELGYAAHLASSVLTWEKDGPEAFMNAAQTALQLAKKDGHDISQLEGVIQSDPTKLKPMLESIIARHQGPPQSAPADYTLGDSRMSGATNQPLATATPKASASAKPASVQEYEYAVGHDGFKGSFKDYQNEDANRAQRAASERAPYFTYQTVFDPQGRPISAIRFDARGGPPVNVDVSAVTGGGQLKPPPGDLGRKAVLNEVSTDQLDRLKKMFNGGGAALVGPASGRLLQLGQKVPGVPVNKTFADFDAASAAFRNAVITAITGAQMGEKEADRIRQQIPEITDKPAVWLSKAEQTRKNLADLNKALQSKGAGAAPGSGGAGVRIRVVGPNGETGTVPDDGKPLPEGWKRAAG